jgi:hypothetical protein
MRHRQCSEGAEAIPVSLGQPGVLAVDEPRRRDRLRCILGVRTLRTGGQHLHVNPGPVHQPEPRRQFGAAAGAHPAPSPAEALACSVK